MTVDKIGVFIVPLAGIIILFFGMLLSMVHVFKIPPMKMWICKKSARARKFVDSEIEHLTKDHAYKVRESHFNAWVQ